MVKREKLSKLLRICPLYNKKIYSIIKLSRKSGRECAKIRKSALFRRFPGIPRPNQAKEIEKPKLSETEKYWSNAKKSNFEYMEKDTMESVKVIVVGFGDRGAAYTKYALDNPDRLKVIAVVESQSIQKGIGKGKICP